MKQSALVHKLAAYVGVGCRKISRVTRIARTLLVHLTFRKRAVQVPPDLKPLKGEIEKLHEAARSGAELVLHRSARRLELRFGASSQGFVNAKGGPGVMEVVAWNNEAPEADRSSKDG